MKELLGITSDLRNSTSIVPSHTKTVLPDHRDLSLSFAPSSTDRLMSLDTHRLQLLHPPRSAVRIPLETQAQSQAAAESNRALYYGNFTGLQVCNFRIPKSLSHELIVNWTLGNDSFGRVGGCRVKGLRK